MRLHAAAAFIAAVVVVVVIAVIVVVASHCEYSRNSVNSVDSLCALSPLCYNIILSLSASAAHRAACVCVRACVLITLSIGSHLIYIALVYS